VSVAIATVVGCLDWTLPDAGPGGGVDGGEDARVDAPDGRPGDDAAIDASADGPAPKCIDAEDAGFVLAAGSPCMELVATDQGDLQHLRVIAGKIYWTTYVPATDQGRIVRANLDGTGSEVFYEAAGTRPKFIASKGNAVLWGEQFDPADEGNSLGAVRMKAIDGTTVESFPTTYAVRGLDVDDTNVYWATWDGRIKRAPLSDGGASDPAELHAGQAEPMELAADKFGYVFARSGDDTTQPGLVIAGDASGVESWKTSDGEGRFPWGVRIDGTRVYWTERGFTDASVPGGVRSVFRVDGGGYVSLCDSERSPLFLSVDGTHVWFVEDNDRRGPSAPPFFRGNLSRVAKTADGGTCDVRVANIVNVADVATGEGYVFWASRAGTVWRMRSP
jgi:hypothetical protein